MRRIKPQTIEELKEVINDVTRTISEEFVRKTMVNISKRCHACIMANIIFKEDLPYLILVKMVSPVSFEIFLSIVLIE